MDLDGDRDMNAEFEKLIVQGSTTTVSVHNPLHDADNADTISNDRGHRRARRTNWVALLLIVAVAVSFLVATSSMQVVPLGSLAPDNCGNSTAEAKANGCFYEPMQRSWIPKLCYTSHPSEEYQPFDDREWFSDKNLTQPLTQHQLEELRTGENITAYTAFFHNEHCLYAWRKMALAVDQRMTWIDTKTYALEHSTHCSKMIAKMIYDVGKHQYGDKGKYTMSPLMFQRCVRLF